MAGADGIALSATRLGPAAAPASVVYIPGLLTDSTYWTPLTSHLRARLDGGIAQIIYSRPKPHLDDRSAARPAVPVLVEDLDTILSLARGAIILVAHSVGSLVLQAWAAQYPRRAGALAGLVLLNPWPNLLDLTALLEAHGARGARRREHRLLAELTSHLYDPPNGGLPRRSRIATSKTDVDALGVVLASYQGTPFTDEVVSVLRGIPTWVLAGLSDPIIAPRRTQMLAERLWADYDVIPGAGHSLPYVDPVRAAEPIVAALEVAYRDHQHGRSSW
ncbi:alpha/beta fold hydrolase [Nocardia xishanensis]|uniref:alpha/beta fold hydrolase n=1 Tax=Nocardia xishanensis TaxID=238964 RepID=UPI0014720316|nr:alpha/beta fold hydrolase [Nocardia xishanensis]